LGADLLTLSAHKLGGPNGVGALVLQQNIHISEPLIRGGGQQRGARAGTENVAGIAGFGAAAAAVREALADERRKVAQMRDDLEERLQDINAETVIFGAAPGVERLPNTTQFAVPGMRSETALIALDLAGCALSAGSACSSGKVAASHVLGAMKVPPAVAACALRASLGPTTTRDEIDMFLRAWTDQLSGLSKGKRGLAA
jgi:cysteine desulfurase